MNFLHGIETVQVATEAGTVNVVKSSILAIVGIAPKGNGTGPIKELATAEVLATATVVFSIGPSIGQAISIYYGGEFICQYTRASNTTLAQFTTAFAAAITTAGWTASASGATLTVTAKAGTGASANGVSLAHTAPDANGRFTGGVDAVYDVTTSNTPQELVLVNNENEDAKFGKTVPGFDIPKALEIVRLIAGKCPVLVVNVFDYSAHTSTVTDEVLTLVEGKCKLPYAPIGEDITIKDANGNIIPTLINVDYTMDAFGNFEKLNNRIANNATIKFTYKKLNASAVTGADIIGEIEPNTNTRTGTKLLDLAYAKFGFRPKILISPYFNTNSGVAATFRALTEKFRAFYLQDAPYGATVQTVMQGRNGVSINFNTTNIRTQLLYPYGKVYDVASNSNKDEPYSMLFAALMIWNDNVNGYWTSPSNKELTILTGIETPIEYSPSDPNCEAMLLNSVGITTIVSSPNGGAFKSFGNRTAAYPSWSDPRNFINLQRLDDMVAETMEEDSVVDLDKGITNSFIDYMKQKGNNLIKKLILDGAVAQGSEVQYFKEDNPAEELANGHIVFRRVYCGFPPAEKITFKNELKISLLSSLG